MINKRLSYAVLERMVIYLYNHDLLTLELLDYIAYRYRQIGVDSAGSNHMRTRDGKDLYQVCIALVEPTFPIVIEGSGEDNEEYWEREQKKWEEIIHLRWGWRTSRTAYQHNSGKDRRKIFKISA